MLVNVEIIENSKETIIVHMILGSSPAKEELLVAFPTINSFDGMYTQGYRYSFYRKHIQQIMLDLEYLHLWTARLCR